MSVVLRRTVWDDIDWRFDNLSGSHDQSISPQTVLLRTTLTQTITVYRIMIWLLDSNHLQFYYNCCVPLVEAGVRLRVCGSIRRRKRDPCFYAISFGEKKCEKKKNLNNSYRLLTTQSRHEVLTTVLSNFHLLFRKKSSDAPTLYNFLCSPNRRPLESSESQRLLIPKVTRVVTFGILRYLFKHLKQCIAHEHCSVRRVSWM